MILHPVKFILYLLLSTNACSFNTHYLISLGTGCMYDNEHIWSITPVPESSLSPQPPASLYYIVCGGSNGSCSDERIREANSDTSWAVRCCSNTPRDGFIRKYPNTCPSNVWGDSEVNGQCHGSKTFEQARGLCSSIGARLCSREELVKDCTRNSGCGYDSRYAWSDTPVPESSSRSYYTVCGRSTSTRCSGGPRLADENELMAVRCCANTSRGAGWIKRSSSCPWADSEINGSCKKGRTFAQAQSSCIGVGARLCTVSELESDCTAGTGCQFDHERVWSSTESGEEPAFIQRSCGGGYSCYRSSGFGDVNNNKFNIQMCKCISCVLN